MLSLLGLEVQFEISYWSSQIMCIYKRQNKTLLCLFSSNTGSKEITWMMLEAGAETDVVNSVGRTAAQMAAFVGKLKLSPNFPQGHKIIWFGGLNGLFLEEYYFTFLH